jgi:hypothetical protein
MAHKRKGQLTITKEWAKHLRKFWRQQFWKGERNAAKNLYAANWKEISFYLAVHFPVTFSVSYFSK